MIDGNSPMAPLPATEWSRRHAAHLLRRSGFGPTAGEIDQAAAIGLHESVRRLLEPAVEAVPFAAASKAFWDAAMVSENIADLKMWWLFRMLRTPNPLVEKMTLFWHNHFATSFAKVRSVAQMATQNALFRTMSLGCFGPLLHAVSQDVAMLVWLDGNANKKRQPNENFARELFELFSLGVGNYSEADIVQAARAFTGWHVRNGAFWFDRAQHDDGVKSIFGKSGRFTGDQVVDLCLASPSCAAFLASKLLRWFVASKVEHTIVAEFAGVLRGNQLNIAASLAALFSSRWFYEKSAMGDAIKSPVELVVGALRTLDVRADQGLAAGPNLPPCFQLLKDLGQDLFEPPNVKGWDGGRSWLSSASYLIRVRFAAQLLAGQPFGKIKDLVEAASLPPDESVRWIANHAFGGELPETLRPLFASRLTQRLPDLLQIALAAPEYQMC